MPEEFSALCDEPARGYKEGVEEYPYPIGGYREATITVERQYFISPIKPGRYRVVVYAGYLPNSTPVYAEFTVEK